MDAFDAKISKAAQESDIAGFEWLTEGKVGATWLAHRLLWYALQKEEEQKSASATTATTNGTASYSPGLQEKLASRFYLAFHNENQDLSSFEVLSKLAVEVGVFEDEAKATEWLKSDEGDYELGHAVDMGAMNGVQSVPFLILQVGSSSFRDTLRHLQADLSSFKDGSDHTSEVVSHSDLMRMFTIQADMV